MAKTDYQSVKQYLAALPPSTRKVVERVLAIVGKAVPRAEAVISYQIAAYKLEGRALIYVAGWKEHFSLYPVTAGVEKAFGAEVARHRDGKGTLRFALDEPIPTRFITGIAKLRAAEVLELAASKASKRKPTKRATSKKAPAKAPAKKRSPSRPRGKSA